MMEFTYWSALAQTYAGTTAGGAYQAQADMVGDRDAAARPHRVERLGHRLSHLLRRALHHRQRYLGAGGYDQRQRQRPRGQRDARRRGQRGRHDHNNSPDYLRIEGITIPDNAGGQVLFNYNAITTQDLANNTPGVSGTGTLNVAGSSGASEPTITITSSSMPTALKMWGNTRIARRRT